MTQPTWHNSNTEAAAAAAATDKARVRSCRVGFTLDQRRKQAPKHEIQLENFLARLTSTSMVQALTAVEQRVSLQSDPHSFIARVHSSTPWGQPSSSLSPIYIYIFFFVPNMLPAVPVCEMQQRVVHTHTHTFNKDTLALTLWLAVSLSLFGRSFQWGGVLCAYLANFILTFCAALLCLRYSPGCQSVFWRFAMCWV